MIVNQKKKHIYKKLMFVTIFFGVIGVQGFKPPHLHSVMIFNGGDFGLAVDSYGKKRTLTIALNGNDFVQNAKALAFESYSLAPVTA